MKYKVYINTNDTGYHYSFTCSKCHRELEIITSAGRYGNLGPFDCPKCKTEYYATIDDHQNPCLYIARRGEQPASLFDSKGRERSVKLPYDGLGMH